MKKIGLLVCSLLMQPVIAQKLTDKFDTLLWEMFKEDTPGAVALVAKGNTILYRKAFGMANLELGVKMKPENVFRIGSITKQFTAAAILKLRDEGKLNLDHDITKYVEDYPTHGHHITVQQLLTHTSGIKNYTEMAAWDEEVRKKDFTPEEFIDFFKNQAMDFKPGEDWRYSNSAYFILGHIIEVVSGMSYEEYIEKTFFEPLNMTNSYYGSTSRIIKDRASGYNKRGTELLNADYISMTQPYASGSLVSTVDDLYKWCSAVMRDEVIRKASRKEAHTTYKLNNGEKTGYGYGWSIGNIQGSPMLFHDGGMIGYLTIAMYLPEEEIFVAVFSNCNCNPPRDLAMKMAALAVGKPYDWKPIPLSNDALREYAAVYGSDNEEQRNITFEDGQLFSFRNAGRKFKIVPYGKDMFFFDGGMTTLQFNRNATGEIVSFTSKSTGYDTELKRTDKPILFIEKIKVDQATTDKYLGKYQLSPSFIISIFKEGSKMYAQGTGQRRIEIFPFENNKFVYVDIDCKLTFNMGENGKAHSLTVHQLGDHDAKKIE
ncbi:MAG: serine hydrolase [Bacteroidota bacterium]